MGHYNIMVMTNIAMENGPFIDGLLYMIWLVDYFHPSEKYQLG